MRRYVVPMALASSTTSCLRVSNREAAMLKVKASVNASSAEYGSDRSPDGRLGFRADELAALAEPSAELEPRLGSAGQ